MLTLSGEDTLSACPGCGGDDFVRASLFSAEPATAEEASGEQTPRRRSALRARSARSRGQLAEARASGSSSPASTSCYDEGDELRTVALSREWTRIGRSLAADVRFDDPTVSRRHALIVRHPDGVRVLDDRSLNGVFVNGARIDGRLLQDGDEIIVGRYRLSFLSSARRRQPRGGARSRLRPTEPGRPCARAASARGSVVSADG